VRIGAVVEIFFARGVRFFSELWLVSADFQQKGESGGAKLTTPAKESARDGFLSAQRRRYYATFLLWTGEIIFCAR
jgi:hypothetical protein